MFQFRHHDTYNLFILRSAPVIWVCSAETTFRVVDSKTICEYRGWYECSRY